MTLLEAATPAVGPPASAADPLAAPPGVAATARLQRPDDRTPDARQVGERLTALLGELGTAADPRVAERAEEIVSLLMQFYGAGLARALELADEAGVLDPLLDRLTGDELVSSILILHDLHPLDTIGRIQAAIDRVRPYLGSHGGGVEVVGIEGDAVRLRMEGSCTSCPSSAVTLNYAIEKAVLEAAPEIARIVVDGLEAPPAGPLIQLEPLGSKGVGAGRGPGGNGHAGHANAGNGHGGHAPAMAVPGGAVEWREVDAAAALAGGGFAAIVVGGTSLVLCRALGELYAYRDGCPNCRARLVGGRLAEAILTCATCGTGFDVRLAGRSVGDGSRHLDPLPLLPAGDVVRIAVPVPS